MNDFEKALAEFTGAPFVITTDSCTHAIELGLRYQKPKMYATIPKKTHFSVPMTLRNLGIEYMFTDDEWEKEYRIEGSIVWDSANYFEKDMFKVEIGKSKLMCISFSSASPLNLGVGGAILTNDRKAAAWLTLAANGGRDLDIVCWEDQKEFNIGYQYYMKHADCEAANLLLTAGNFNKPHYGYPDLSNIVFNS